MKKLIAIVLATALVLALGVTVFAADSTKSATLPDESGAKSTSQTVCVQSLDSEGNPITPADDPDSKIEKVYSVTVDFDKLHFEYKFNCKEEDMAWDAANHKYVSADDGSALTGEWTSATANQKVTVKNHSNASVEVTAAFADGGKTATKSGVTATISANDKTLDSAEGTTVAEAPKTEYTVSTSGQPTKLGDFVVDTVTVTFAVPED